jgi:hypothetical protein
MLSRIIDLCARNRFLVFTSVLLLTLAGSLHTQTQAASSSALQRVE